MQERDQNCFLSRKNDKESKHQIMLKPIGNNLIKLYKFGGIGSCLKTSLNFCDDFSKGDLDMFEYGKIKIEFWVSFLNWGRNFRYWYDQNFFCWNRLNSDKALDESQLKFDHVTLIFPKNKDELISIFNDLSPYLKGSCFIFTQKNSDIDVVPENNLNARIISCIAPNKSVFLLTILHEHWKNVTREHDENTKRLIQVALGMRQRYRFTLFNYLPAELVLKITDFIDPHYNDRPPISISSLFKSVEKKLKKIAEEKFDCRIT